MGVLGEHRAVNLELGHPLRSWNNPGLKTPKWRTQGLKEPGGLEAGTQDGKPGSAVARVWGSQDLGPTCQQWHLLPESPGVGSETNVSSFRIPRVC